MNGLGWGRLPAAISRGAVRGEVALARGAIIVLCAFAFAACPAVAASVEERLAAARNKTTLDVIASLCISVPPRRA